MSVTLRPKEAWKMLQDAGITISIEKLKQGIRQQRWSWADYIAAESDGEKEVYIIYANLDLSDAGQRCQPADWAVWARHRCCNGCTAYHQHIRRPNSGGVAVCR